MVTLSVAVVAWLLTVGVVAGAVHGRAEADTCLPSPTMLFGEVARVAGTDSTVWADIQRVEQVDAAKGASGSGQVVQDMLDVASHDGYWWDCAASQLVDTASGTHPAQPTISASPGAPAIGQPATSTVIGRAGSVPNGDTPSPTITDETSSVVAAGTTAASGQGHALFATVLLGLLVLASVALLVVVVRRQMLRS